MNSLPKKTIFAAWIFLLAAAPAFCKEPSGADFQISSQECTDRPLKIKAEVSGVFKDGQLVYEWDFGDGKKSSGQEVSPRYSQAGDYEITLTVKDSKNPEMAPLVVKKKIHINAPPEPMLTKVAPVCVRKRGNKFRFDASASFDPEGRPLTFSWDFGDGTTGGNSKKITHRFKKAGMYKVTVKVDDGSGSACAVQKDKIYVKINTPPDLKIEVPKTGKVGESAVFDASASSDADGDTLSYYWGFGDGQNATEPKTEHRFSQKGKYRVFFAMDDNAGTECSGVWKKYKVSVA